MWKLMVILFFSFFLITCKKEKRMVKKWRLVEADGGSIKFAGSGDTYLIISEDGTFSRKDQVTTNSKYMKIIKELYGTWVKTGDKITFTINDMVYIHTSSGTSIDVTYHEPCTDIFILQSVSLRKLVLKRIGSSPGCFCDSYWTTYVFEKFKKEKD